MKNERLFIDFILDIYRQITLIEKFIKGIKYPEFEKSELLIYSCSRALEIIGEAVKKIPDYIIAEYPEIHWNEIAKMRDILIHYYYGADENIIWNACKYDIRSLKKVVIKIFNKSIKLIEDRKVKNILMKRLQSIKERNKSKEIQ